MRSAELRTFAPAFAAVCATVLIADVVTAARLASAQDQAAPDVAPRAERATAEGDYLATIQQAVAAYDAQDLATALRLFERAHALQPGARTHRAVGITLFELEDYGQAAARLELALQDARQPLDAAQREEAEAMLDEARTRAPGQPWNERSVEPAPLQRPITALSTIPAPQDREPGLGARRTAALVAGGVGVAGVAVGVVAGVRSMHLRSLGEDNCDGTLCNPRGYDAMTDSRTAGDVSTVAWSIGLGALVGAAALWLTGSSDGRADAGATAWLDFAPRPLGIRAAF